MGRPYSSWQALGSTSLAATRETSGVSAYEAYLLADRLTTNGQPSEPSETGLLCKQRYDGKATEFRFPSISGNGLYAVVMCAPSGSASPADDRPQNQWARAAGDLRSAVQQRVLEVYGVS